jgi:ribosomal protein S18 acetylase RimI-like enzyme
MDYTIVDGQELAQRDAEQSRLIVDWLFSTGEKAFETQFGDREQAFAVLTDWLSRDTSEFSLNRSRIALDPAGKIAGGCFTGKAGDVERARFADMMAKLRISDPAERRRYQAYLAEVRDAVPTAASDAEYLSAIAVLPAHRGRGVAQRLMEDWLRRGRARGGHVFELIVEERNTAAQALYRRFGFIPITKGSAPSAGLTWIVMRLDENGAADN